MGWLSSIGWKARGWDPVHRPETRKTRTAIVGLNFVVNVIEDPLERDKVLNEAWALATGVLIVSARLTDERDAAHIKPRADGWMTSRGTFQKFYEHHELGTWISLALRAESVAAAPGVFYVFKRVSEREDFLARRYKIRFPAPFQRKGDKQFVEHRAVLEPLIEFFAAHGRLPATSELPSSREIESLFGSIGRAFRVVEVVTDRDEWLLLAQRRRIDLLVYLAVRLFDGEYRMADLPSATQRDVRAHFQSLKNATENARRLLFAVGNLDQVGLACRSSTVGKLTPSALYVHIDAAEFLPGLLKVYEACARRIAGDVPDANLIKLHRESKKISYLVYPDFDSDPHPALLRSVIVDLSKQRLSSRTYPLTGNVPILHRKEEFVHQSDVRWESFKRVTEAEVSAGLYSDTTRIGYRDSWNQLLKERGFALRPRDKNHREPLSARE